MQRLHHIIYKAICYAPRKKIRIAFQLNFKIETPILYLTEWPICQFCTFLGLKDPKFNVFFFVFVIWSYTASKTPLKCCFLVLLHRKYLDIFFH